MNDFFNVELNVQQTQRALVNIQMGPKVISELLLLGIKKKEKTDAEYLN